MEKIIKIKEKNQDLAIFTNKKNNNKKIIDKAQRASSAQNRIWQLNF